MRTLIPGFKSLTYKDWLCALVILLFLGAIVGECAMINRGCEEEKAHNTALMDKCIAKVKTMKLRPTEAKTALDLCWNTGGGLP